MRPYFSSISLLLFFFVFIFHGVRAHNFIHDTCKKCSKTDPNLSYNFCVNSLQSVPSSHCARTLLQVGMISLKLVKHNLTDTKNYTKQLLGSKRLDPFMKACLSDCYDLYSDARATIKQAMVDYLARRYADANVEVSSVLDAATTCEDGFKEKGGSVSPLTKRNNNAFQLSAISLSIINMLH